VRGDGTIDEQEVAIVQKIGAWMKVNGEAIYATVPGRFAAKARPSTMLRRSRRRVFNEGKIKLGVDDIRFTTKGNVLYAIVLGWPTKPVTIKSLGRTAGLLNGSIADITLVGGAEKIDWAQADDAVTIQPPETKLFDEAAVFKVTVKE